MLGIDEILDHEARARQRLANRHFTALNALGKFDLAVARKQRHHAHLAEINPDGITALVQSASSEIGVGEIFDLIILLLEVFRFFNQFDRRTLEIAKKVIESGSVRKVIGHGFIHAVVEAEAFVFTVLHELPSSNCYAMNRRNEKR